MHVPQVDQIIMVKVDRSDVIGALAAPVELRDRRSDGLTEVIHMPSVVEIGTTTTVDT